MMLRQITAFPLANFHECGIIPFALAGELLLQFCATNSLNQTHTHDYTRFTKDRLETGSTEPTAG